MNAAMLGKGLRGQKFNTLRTSVRNSGHYLKKNIWVEENAGLRENTYKTWKFTIENSIKIASYLFIPGVLFFFASMEEAKKRDKNVGRERLYGPLPRKID